MELVGIWCIPSIAFKAAPSAQRETTVLLTVALPQTEIPGGREVGERGDRKELNVAFDVLASQGRFDLNAGTSR